MTCVRSVSYSVQLNGNPYNPFEAKKGLRQGGFFLSPLLFAFSMEYLKDDLDFNFHPICEIIALPHLKFAHDLLLIARSDHSSVSKIMAAFRKFSLASGFEASIEKSCIYIAGVLGQEAVDIADVVSLPVGTLYLSILGPIGC